jgi:hypothetical protein
MRVIEGNVAHHRYRTTVDGIGIVYEGDSAMEAHGAYSLFVSQSKMADAGDGKSVIVFKDCEIVRKYISPDPFAR